VSLEGRGEEGLKKEEGRSGKNRELWKRMTLSGLVFFKIQNSFNLVELKNCIG